MENTKKVTVIGGGGTAVIMAAYLTLQGHQVTVCDEEWHGAKLKAITDWIAPHLKDGQIVCFSEGNCASITLKKKRGDKKVIVGQMQGNIGSCRLVSPTKKIKGNPHTLLPPSYDWDSEYLRITGTPRKVSK